MGNRHRHPRLILVRVALMKTRYAFVALAAMSVLLAGLSMLFTVRYVDGSDRKFCQVITGVTAVPVPRPSDPSANPSREQAYEWYERFAVLGRSLGC
jgi:hypothetical protein